MIVGILLYLAFTAVFAGTWFNLGRSKQLRDDTTELLKEVNRLNAETKRDLEELILRQLEDDT